MGKPFKIAGGHSDTVESAKNILEAGGNAFDAAIAGVFSSMISEFLYTGAASGGAMMIKKNGKPPLLIDFFIETPAVTPEKIQDFRTIYADFGDIKQEFNIGSGSVGIPGTLPGLISIHKQYGSLPFSTLVEQAVKLSRTGSILSKNQEYVTQVLFPVVSNNQDLFSLFSKNGKLIKKGDTFKNKQLGDFLEQFMYQKNPEAFYKEEVCPIFFDSMKNGGFISLNDLQDYSPKIRRPLNINYYGHDIFLNPEPSTGGRLINDGLKFLSNEATISKKVFEKALLKIQTLNQKDMVGSTTHLTVIDGENNVSSVTTTNGVGAGFLFKDTGIMPNNILGEKHLNPFGFHNWKLKQRIPSNICPTIIQKGEKNIISLGSAGSSRIISAILCVITNIINKKMSLKRAIATSRIHLEGNVLHCESDNENVEFKSKEIVYWNEKNMFFGGVNACSLNESIADKRRNGCVF